MKQSNISKLNVHLAVENMREKEKRKSEKIKIHQNSDDVDSDIISNYIGHYGWWQFRWTFILCLFQIPSTFHVFGLVFQAAPRDYWCARPANLESLSIDIWRNLSQPNGACSILNLDYTRFTTQNFETEIADMNTSTNNLIECQKFEFDGSLIGETVQSDWNLVCDATSFTSVVEMCFLAGAAVGSLCSGWISDRFGRKKTLMGFAITQSIVGFSIYFIKLLPLYMVARFIIGITSISVVIVSFVLVVELISGKYRTTIGILNIIAVPAAYIIETGISYVAHDWRTMQLCIVIGPLFLLFIGAFAPESPRWLWENYKIEQLIDVIERAAKSNKIKLPSDYEQTLIPSKSARSSLTDDIEDISSEKLPVINILDLFRSGYCRISILMLIIWFALVLIYYGLTLHLSNLGGNVYLNTIIAGFVEALSIFASVFVVLKLGLRINLFIYMLVAGISCIMVNFAPEGNTTFVITFAMIGKCAIGANNAIIPTFTAFQYPTVMRNLGVGVGNFAAGLALIVVPYLWLLEHIHSFLPMTIMGVTGIIGAIALLMMKDNSIKKTSSQERVLDEAETPSTSTPAYKATGLDNISFIHTER